MNLMGNFIAEARAAEFRRVDVSAAPSLIKIYKEVEPAENKPFVRMILQRDDWEELRKLEEENRVASEKYLKKRNNRYSAQFTWAGMIVATQLDYLARIGKGKYSGRISYNPNGPALFYNVWLADLAHEAGRIPEFR